MRLASDPWMPAFAGMTKVVVVVASLALASLAAPAAAETLKLGNEGTYPPFSVVDASGKVTGMEPDLAREMCKRMKVECELVVMDFKALIPSMLQGKLDIIVSQITPLPERKERALFSRIILQNLYRWVVPVNSDYRFDKVGLKGVRIGLQRGGATAKYIMDNFSDVVVPVFYDNPDQIKMELLSKRIDITIGPRVNWLLELLEKPEGKDWKFAGDEYWLGDPATPEDERGLSWIVRKTDGAPLLKRMDAALTEIITDCTYTKIREQYVKFSTLPAEAPCLKR
jgi:ABC-type amino acid transport substrate-binding protein